MSLIGRVGWVKTQICTMSLFSVFFFIELFPKTLESDILNQPLQLNWRMKILKIVTFHLEWFFGHLMVKVL